MAYTTIDAPLLARLFIAGANNLNEKKDWINDLNVFPVPDGDTGTNMTMTIMSAAKDVSGLVNTNDVDMTTLCKAVSSGSLRGARGNSGVILSQLLRGFCKEAREHDILDIQILAAASVKAVETAYKAVMKPKEGTILTVARGMSDKAVELSTAGCEDLDEFFREVIICGDETLEKTPDLLPVLKQAGVVDSGGQGLMQVMKGAYEAFCGKQTDFTIREDAPGTAERPKADLAAVEADIKFGYCTEFIIMLNKIFNIKTEMDFKAYLESIGDSIVCVADDEVVKVHVHTNDPGLAIQKALMYGELSNLKIDNMRLEHREVLFNREQEQAGAAEGESAPMEHKDSAFIAVSVGDGLNEIFRSLGVDYIIEGGQTM
nr:DAK2 domain-containing protein [Lachnospiraceae bacterium]